MELLPAERNVRILEQRGPLTEQALQRFDAAIIGCPEESAESTLRSLPHGQLWQKLYREARKSGTPKHLSARVGTAATPVVVLFVKTESSPFDRLTRAARAWKELGPPPKASVALAVHDFTAEHGALVLESLLAAGLAWSAPLPQFKSTKSDPPKVVKLTLVVEDAKVDIERTRAIDSGNHLARWLTMLPPNVLDTLAYRRALQTLARRHGWQFTFHNDAALRRAGAGAFLAVTRANIHRGAGIARLRYRPPRGRNVPRLALVGKGICFDTGGINLKTHKSMYHMHEDMQGSAVAVGTLLALAKMQVPYEIDCWVAITENQIGARAYRPQEVVRALNGTTIQVAHSDAEGRMVLADTLTLAARENPDLIIDYATLTGACVNALTERFSGAFTNRPEWNERIERAGRKSGERVWPFPMDEDFDSELESQIADVLQCTPDSKGDHILAARFLNRFVPPEIPWIHLDLSSSSRSGGLAHIPTEITGFGVRYTVYLLEEDILSPRSRSAGKMRARR
ncbi:MAG: M17 family metallopeptidase [Gammaproteobacteria bacterium]|nr:peptidase M17 [Gammaproteobacteria bacterium]